MEANETPKPKAAQWPIQIAAEFLNPYQVNTDVEAIKAACELC